VAREDEAGDGAVDIVPGALWDVKGGRKGKTTLLRLGARTRQPGRGGEREDSLPPRPAFVSR